MKSMFLAATALAFLCTASPALAQADKGAAPDRDPYGYYSDQDKEGYYDREGNYVRNDRDKPDSDGYREFATPKHYYRSGDYESECRSGNAAAGTFFGALAGGLIGGAASGGGHGPRHHGSDPGAVIGGVIIGGLLGNAMTRDMPCEDHGRAFSVYAEGLNGTLGERYEWSNDETGDHGDIVPQREFRRGGALCRAFTETTFVHGERQTRDGVACRRRDGNWNFD
jgi:surface antigen